MVRSCSLYTVRQQWIEQPHKFSLNVRRSFTEPMTRSYHRQIPSFCTCKSVWNKHEQTILFCPGNRVSLKFNPSLKVSSKNHFFKGSFASQGDSVHLLLVREEPQCRFPSMCVLCFGRWGEESIPSVPLRRRAARPWLTASRATEVWGRFPSETTTSETAELRRLQTSKGLRFQIWRGQQEMEFSISKKTENYPVPSIQHLFWFFWVPISPLRPGPAKQTFFGTGYC